eukprot:TRINITY_DN0_c0_g1_i1.p1 TRINITY_DN0_c0_g1~~TRINITY_DN0_c0_g1_i1.p1  ORF type:complete len:413 (+),score=147.13 TRINITY_DN0_c0_g1_i1:74-1312(+)
MRKEIFFSFVLLLVTCLTVTSARSIHVRQATDVPKFVPGVLPWDPPVQNLRQSASSKGSAFEYTISLSIVKTVSRVSVNFTFPSGVSAVSALTDGWVVDFDGSAVSVTLNKNVNAGTALKFTLKVTSSVGFNFPSQLTTTCDFDGQPETQEFNFQPSTGLPTAAPTEPENFISTAGQSISTDGLGTYQFTFTFKAFRALDNLAVSFSFPNTEVVRLASATKGATATNQNGVVTVTYANPIVADTTITTTISVTPAGGFNSPNTFTFSTSTPQGPQTQTLTFKTKPSPSLAPTPAIKPLGFSQINQGIKSGRGYLEVAYYLELTAGANLDSWFAEMTFPMTINKVDSDTKSTSTLSAGNAVKVAYKTPIASGTKFTVTAYLRVPSYSNVQLPKSINFFYTVGGAQHQTTVKFT